MHRFILDPPNGQQVDHVNGNRLDNRRENIRLCSHSQNMANSKKRTWTKQSIFKGVSYELFKKRGKGHGMKRNAKPWRVMIIVHGKRHRLGRFKTELEAALAYDIAARNIGASSQASTFQNPKLRCRWFSGPIFVQTHKSVSKRASRSLLGCRLGGSPLALATQRVTNFWTPPPLNAARYPLLDHRILNNAGGLRQLWPVGWPGCWPGRRAGSGAGGS